MLRLFLFIIIIIFLFGCSDSSVQSPNKIEYSKEGIPALVMVVENSDYASEQLESIAFNSYKYETLDILSEIFEVPYDSLINKDLNQILDQYAEPWQIEQITKVALSYYNKIIVLTDESASMENLLDSLALLNDSSYTIDVVFSLQGTESTISFKDSTYPIGKLTLELINREITIRTLYQTNCSSAAGVNNWNGMGIFACNGTMGTNYLTIFAPQYFLYSWVSGDNYSNSVQYAYDREIETLRSFNTKLPLLDLITTGNYISGSLPILSGKDIFITKNDYIITNSN